MRARSVVLLALLTCSGWSECSPAVQREPADAPAGARPDAPTGTPAARPPADAPGPAKPGEPAAAPRPDEPASAGPDEALACKVDADCPVLACGPCTPGAPITRAMRDGPDCTRNPCKGSASLCKGGACVIHPGTHKDPAVWGDPPR